MSDLIRHTDTTPIDEDFASAVGTPIVINTVDGRLYVMTDAGVIAIAGQLASYAVGSPIVPTGYFLTHVKRLELTGSNRLTIQGTARVSVYG